MKRKRKKSKKACKTHYLPTEKEVRARDRKIEEDAERARADRYHEQRARGQKTTGESLKIIQGRGTSYCHECGKEKPVKDFYSYYNDLGELIKIFPMCKVCDRKHHKSGRSLVIEEKRKCCLEHYGKAKAGKLCCSSCRNNVFSTLVLFSMRHKNTRALATDKTYSRLYNFNFPDVKFKVLCFNCAYKKIHSYKHT